ncbi:type I polyketide synthase [Mesobacterium pallidum]|uniref:type I polyketide synthase n=1 Tax=Mesobacterium pallidum TaxID=2872037 RepID=UPI001EE31FBB|nr:type I polyketide synthase [Mesobacterium pallidum]
MTDQTPPGEAGANDIAIVGMAAHLPGAQIVDSYWANLRDGIRSIRKLTEDEMRAAGVPEHLLRHRNYVPHAAPLDGVPLFDGEFFGFGPKESAILDPQHRHFLETAWEALESAAHVPGTFPGRIGVFAGCGQGTYYWQNILSNPDLVDGVGTFLLRHTGNDKDFLSTRLSHVLDLRGPSLTLQTACSTSLVAVHYASQALLTYECDMALAGGVTIEFPQHHGYLYKEGEILSPDGECHAFDHRAQGTVFGSGAGVVVLRRLADAIADGDHIWAVIKGSAVNNDGSDKAGYLAPSVGGQAAAIAEAQAIAGISAETVDYVECHGTGTYLGDPIEVAALTEAFRETTQATGFARIGSVKTNIGHLDTAAGAASLIKTALALHHKQIPPSLGYEAPNPAIDFDHSPFRVNDTLTPWVSHAGPRRAGVNSLGVGGTNAHVVLEEAPQRMASEPSDWPFQPLVISARSKGALDGNGERLTDWLKDNPTADLADVAWTLKAGRRAMERRRVLVADDPADAAAQLAKMDPRRVFTHQAMADPDVVFMFPGGGAQYAGMARDLYETEPVFRDWMDRGLSILQPRLDYDIRALWLPDGDTAEADERLKTPSVQLPLIMITEYALAQLWMSWGVTPAALIGHSMGENTAACVAGVMSFEDCIALVHLRGRLFDTVPAGGMLSVSLPAAQLTPYLGDTLDLASVNAPALSVASGPQAALDDLAQRLAADGHDSQRVQIDIAAHSRMLDPILEDFRGFLRGLTLSKPQIPFISNRTGDWITDSEAASADYWTAHLRGTVHFADGLTTLAQEDDRIFLEVGPGKALSSLAQAHDRITANQVIGTLRHPGDAIADDKYFVLQLARLWAAGANFDWDQIWAGARRNRLVLPTYAFQRAPYFIDRREAQTAPAAEWLLRKDEIADWGWVPAWRPRLADCLVDTGGDLSDAPRQTWLVFADDTGLGAAVIRRLRAAGHHVTEVRTGDAFAKLGPDTYSLSPERGREGYDQLIAALTGAGITPTSIAHFWLTTRAERFRPGSSFFHRNLEQGFFSLLFLAQAMAEENLPPAHITAVTTGAAQVRSEALPYPEKATIAGPIRMIPREMPGMTCASLDVVLPDAPRRGIPDMGPLAEQVLEDLLATPESATAALRGAKRFVQDVTQKKLPAADHTLPDGAVVLLTGGFGGIGLTLAEDMIAKHGARIALLSRTPLPDRAEWDAHLRARGPADLVSRRIAAVQRLEARGGTVLVVAADVCNIEEMRAALATITDQLGAPDALIHGAGVIDDAPLMTKTQASVEDVFTPKIHGLQVLDQLFPDGALKLMVLFSSSSTVTAPAGQVDYVAANEYLNAYARSRSGGQTRVTAINWGIWAHVGMAAEAVAQRRGETPLAPEVPVSQPLLRAATFDAAGNRRFTGTLGPDDWIIGEHRTAEGLALLPGTGYLELIAEALEAQGESGGFTIHDLYFLRPFDVDAGPKSLRIELHRSDAGYDVEIRSEATVAGRSGWALNAQAQVSLAPEPATAPLDLAALRARIPVTEAAPGETLTSPQEAHLAFGSRWRVLRAQGTQSGEGLARLVLPKAASADLKDGFRLHPALLDLATGWAMDLIPGYTGDRLWVPLSYGTARIHAPLPAEVWSHVRLAESTGSTAAFDITLSAPDGTVLAEIARFTIKRLDGALAITPPRANELSYDPSTDTAQPLSPAEERLHHNLEQGIRPDEGPEAFRRALALNLPQVVVTSLDLAALRDQAAQTDSDGAGGQSFERPELDSDYVAPETDIERTLAGFWQDLLGVTDVGVEDSFFDLGGHSLIAVRLFAMIKKAYRVDFPISVLFEAPTIRSCAALIEERVGPQDTSGEAPKAQAPRRRYTHLVPMHEGEGGPKTPFFLVAGMFGNVLNLRHLAHLLGTDRRFYGLQARGLLGDAEPHRDLTEAATDYIAEMRQVQPRGPYLLGGFSGGGITAYEIARQLEAAGEEVALLVMLDTPLPQRRPLALRDRMVIQWQELTSRGPLYIAAWAMNRIRWEISKRRDMPVDQPATGFHDAAIEAAFYDAIARYQVHDWAGPLKLFRPPLVGKWQVAEGRWVNSERTYVTPDNDWSLHAPNLEVFEVPGDHDSMVLEPNVRVLAARIAKCIAAAEARMPKLAPRWDNASQAAE